MKIHKLLFLSMLVCFCKVSSQSDYLNKEKERIKTIITMYQDSLKILDMEILKIEKGNFQNSIKEGSIILYSKPKAELREKPFTGAETIKKLPVNTELILISKIRSYWEVKTIYGTGFISSIYVNETQSSERAESFYSNQNVDNSFKTFSKNYSNSKKTSNSSYKRSYSKSRNYIRGPRGGCYFINSNGNKTYVDKSKC